MRILILHGHLSMGGEEKVLMNILKNLDELKYEVDLLITWNHKKNNLFENEIPKSVNYEFLFKKYEGKNSLIKEFIRVKARKQYPKIIKEKIKNKKYDVVVDYSSNLLKLKNIDIDIPIVSWVHFSLTFGKKLDEKKIEEYKEQYKKYTKIVTICDDMKKEFVEKLKIDTKKIEMIYNPIDIKSMQEKAEEIEEKYKKYLDVSYFLQVSRLTEQKQPEQLIEIFYKLKQKGVKEKLYLIGSTKENNIIEQKIKEYKLENDVILFGQIENPYPFFKNAKLFLHTAKYEGLGMVLIESLTFGVPVIAYDCPTGPRDIIGKNSEYGKLVPLNNQEFFLENVLELINEKEIYEYYKTKSLERKEIFTLEINKKKLYELFEGIKNKN